MTQGLRTVNGILNFLGLLGQIVGAVLTVIELLG